MKSLILDAYSHNHHLDNVSTLFLPLGRKSCRVGKRADPLNLHMGSKISLKSETSSDTVKIIMEDFSDVQQHS